MPNIRAPLYVSAVLLAAAFGAAACSSTPSDDQAAAPDSGSAAITATVPSAAVAETTAGATEVEPTVVTAHSDLFADGKFASAADIKAASEGGEEIVFVDSRVALDYEARHIPGALHVPYFEAADHLEEMPRDKWIVTYCECPHAEAEQVADVLLDNGYTMVRVMDEGLQGWEAIGGAVEAGTPPPPANG